MYAKNIFNDPVLSNGFKKISYNRYLAGNFGFPVKRTWKTYVADYYWIKRDKENSRYDYEIRMRIKLMYWEPHSLIFVIYLFVFGMED